MRRAAAICPASSTIDKAVNTETTMARIVAAIAVVLITTQTGAGATMPRGITVAVAATPAGRTTTTILIIRRTPNGTIGAVAIIGMVTGIIGIARRGIIDTTAGFGRIGVPHIATKPATATILLAVDGNHATRSGAFLGRRSGRLKFARRGTVRRLKRPGDFWCRHDHTRLC